MIFKLYDSAKKIFQKNKDNSKMKPDKVLLQSNWRDDGPDELNEVHFYEKKKVSKENQTSNF